MAEAWDQAEPVAAALLAAFPQHLDADHFDQTSFLWAVQLWYAYSMQVFASFTQYHIAQITVRIKVPDTRKFTPHNTIVPTDW